VPRLKKQKDVTGIEAVWVLIGSTLYPLLLLRCQRAYNLHSVSSLVADQLHSSCMVNLEAGAKKVADPFRSFLLNAHTSLIQTGTPAAQTRQKVAFHSASARPPSLSLSSLSLSLSLFFFFIISSLWVISRSLRVSCSIHRLSLSTFQ